MAVILKKILARQNEITADFLKEIDKHLQDILEGRATEMFEIRDLAAQLFIHPTHLSNTIKLVTGKAPCFFFEEKIMVIAKSMLEENKLSIGQIAALLTFDPSNFTKFFKRFAGLTPKQYREQVLEEKFSLKTETVTI
ncbi:DNA-binding transcriptional regulator AraC [compost metagenome]